MLTSDNIQHALLFKRRMEISRFEAKLNGIKKQEKKALMSKDHHKNEFIQQNNAKRKEWWKADKSFREMIQRTTDSRLSSRPISTLSFSKEKIEDSESKEDIKNFLINKSIEICHRTNSNEDTKLIRSRVPGQKVTFVRISSAGSNANLVKSLVEPFPIILQEQKSNPSLPIISKSSGNNSVVNSKKKSKTILLTKEKSLDGYDHTFKRFLNNSPFIVENKNVIRKIERQQSFVQHQVKINKMGAAKRDIRFDNLLNSLNAIKLIKLVQSELSIALFFSLR
ncbi:hypothetical protein BpHYR1_040963, partial [Brachionus plicatilis]